MKKIRIIPCILAAIILVTACDISSIDAINSHAFKIRVISCDNEYNSRNYDRVAYFIRKAEFSENCNEFTRNGVKISKAEAESPQWFCNIKGKDKGKGCFNIQYIGYDEHDIPVSEGNNTFYLYTESQTYSTYDSFITIFDHKHWINLSGKLDTTAISQPIEKTVIEYFHEDTGESYTSESVDGTEYTSEITAGQYIVKCKAYADEYETKLIGEAETVLHCSGSKTDYSINLVLKEAR